MLEKFNHTVPGSEIADIRKGGFHPRRGLESILGLYLEGGVVGMEFMKFCLISPIRGATKRSSYNKSKMDMI